MYEKQILIKMALDVWDTSLNRINTFLNSVSDEELGLQVAPGRNSAKWIIGHLAVINDNAIKVLGIGDSFINPELINYYKEKNKGLSIPATAVSIRHFWNRSCNLINEKIAEFTVEDWFAKHNSVSQEDFIIEPYRNRLNIILTRAFHISHHIGQLVLLKK